ncbi:hypothetical protein PSPO01_15741 [Paraphaeosphaeria sporulosa]
MPSATPAAPPIPSTANPAAPPAPHLRSPVTPRTAKLHAKPRTNHGNDHLPNCETCGEKPGRKSVELGCSNCRKSLCTNCRTRRASVKEDGTKQYCGPCRERGPDSQNRRREKALRECEQQGQDWTYCSGCRKRFGPSSTCYCKPSSALRQSVSASAATPNPRERLGMQMRAPYKDTIEKILQGITVFLSSPRAQTAGPESFDKLAKGSANAEVDSPVLAVTDEQLDEMRSSGQKLPDCVSCVLVPEKSGRKIDDTFEVFRSQCKGWDAAIEYQQYTQSSGNGKEEEEALTGFMLLEDFFGRVTERGQHPELQRIEAERKDPINVLSLSAEILGSAFREPEAVTTLRYRLLSVLSKRSIGHSTETGVGKLSVQPARLVDLEACLKFLLYGERGSFSGYHMDVLNGTWVQCKTGLKLWRVCCGPWDEAVQKRYAEDGLDWKPAPATVQGILLRPGDTLIMRPGYPSRTPS